MSVARVRSWTSSRIIVEYRDKMGSAIASRRSIPSVMYLRKVISGVVTSSNRIEYPTSFPSVTLGVRKMARVRYQRDRPVFVVGSMVRYSFRMGAMRLTVHLLSHALRDGCSGNSPGLRTSDCLPLQVRLVTVAHELGYSGAAGDVEARFREN